MAKKVLVVDDSHTIRQQVGILLTEAGYEVLLATDGHEGMQQIRANPDLGMVVCDVHMPDMSGLEMLRQLKTNPTDSKPPVLMLTTDATPAAVGEAREHGARGWIVKPFKPETLLACVRRLAGEP